MRHKPNQQIVHLLGIVDGRVVDGTVSFSPAPQPGVLSELAKFEAERIFRATVEDEIRAGRM